MAVLQFDSGVPDARGFAFILLVLAPIASHAAAIHDAAKTGDVAAIAAALDAGADVDESDGQATPLYLAVRGGRRQNCSSNAVLMSTPPRRRVWVLPLCRLWQNAGSI
ncbi:ankyrin repeat domain-containing protein [Mesorhizobium sp.]|uniref:ankyrin repeat domain-containing protein n=1 Tax=Mesorhizobium sp. TaxID=1871066 RepID=UPI00257CFE84|nr:ankyrin repeat domain-containing protein [Mesorhizobium sp.]